jgi:hypothetical protein
MTKPLHIVAFEHFQQKYDGDDKVKMFVAFGLFCESEYKWAQALHFPTDGKYKNYHACSIPHSIDMIDQSANKTLGEYLEDIVEGEKADFLREALEAYKEEAAKPERKWWHGVLEATGGAVLWSAILIIGAIVAGRMGVDVFAAFEHAASIHHEAPTPSPSK